MKRENIEADLHDPRYRYCRHKTPAHEVLELIDEQLKSFGLEIVLDNCGDIDPLWRIDKRNV